MQTTGCQYDALGSPVTVTSGSSGGYSLDGTIGRVDAGMLIGGFWSGAMSQSNVFLPLI